MSTGGEVANAADCKSAIHGFESHPVLHNITGVYTATCTTYYPVNFPEGQYVVHVAAYTLVLEPRVESAPAGFNAN